MKFTWFTVCAAAFFSCPAQTQQPPTCGGNATDWTWATIPPSKKLRWFGCFGEENLQCARLSIPMDWQAPSEDQRVVLAVIRRRATNMTDYRGPVIVNPGGTGGSGVFYLRNHGAYVQSVVGANYDILSFDPRGIGASTPRYSCFDTPEERAAWDLQDPGIVDSFPDYSLAGALYSRAEAMNQLCERNVEQTGLAQHSGTTYIARDMLAILDQTGFDDLAYWGFSYGTLIGNLFAAMYPDRVGKILSDANSDMDEWFLQEGKSFLDDAETVMAAFFYYCHAAGSARCAYYEDSSEAIKSKFNRLLAGIKKQPLIIPASGEVNGPLFPEMVTYAGLRRLLWHMLYQPYFEWPVFAQILDALEKGNSRPFYNYYHPVAYGPPASMCGEETVSPFTPLLQRVSGTPEAYGFIQCSDRPGLTDIPVEEATEEARALIDWSPSAGAVNWENNLRCVGRTIRPKWRFEGPYGANTKNPILFVNDAADPVTPLSSAERNSARFPGSIVLAQESFGHTFLAAPSQCTARYINEYFQRGTLPENGTVCPGDYDPFMM